MTRSRDDFSQRTKTDLALRASYHCSYCKCSTVGPSDEGPDAVTMIGVAAHICAAASGPGARRYDATMTSEQRAHIDNGIWLCGSCSILIDRDEVRFSAEVLREMRREHEASRQIGGAGDEIGDIVAIGPDILAVGNVVRSGPVGMRVRLSHFIEGSARDLFAFVHDFDGQPREKRYVLINELGYGSLLETAPIVERVGRNFELEFCLQARLPRRDATEDVATFCDETFELIYGMDAYIQNFERTLGMARGTWFASINDGSDISDLYWRYRGSPWFERVATMEMIRLSSVPSTESSKREPSTPFVCVRRVNRVVVPTFELEAHKLKISVDFDIEGLGRWSGDLSVFISLPEELAEGRANAKAHHETIRSLKAKSRLLTAKAPVVSCDLRETKDSLQ